MEENLTMNVADVATNETVIASANSGKKSGLVISIVAVATLGVAFGTYKLVNHLRRKKAFNKVEQTQNVE